MRSEWQFAHGESCHLMQSSSRGELLFARTIWCNHHQGANCYSPVRELVRFQIKYIFARKTTSENLLCMASDKVQYLVALIAEFSAHYGISTQDVVRYLQRYKALDLYNRQYDYLHTQSFESNIRDITAYCQRMGGTI